MFFIFYDTCNNTYATKLNEFKRIKKRLFPPEIIRKPGFLMMSGRKEIK